jgi:hypothetical protein
MAMYPWQRATKKKKKGTKEKEKNKQKDELKLPPV